MAGQLAVQLAVWHARHLADPDCRVRCGNAGCGRRVSAALSTSCTSCSSWSSVLGGVLHTSHPQLCRQMTRARRGGTSREGGCAATLSTRHRRLALPCAATTSWPTRCWSVDGRCPSAGCTFSSLPRWSALAADAPPGLLADARGGRVVVPRRRGAARQHAAAARVCLGGRGAAHLRGMTGARVCVSRGRRATLALCLRLRAEATGDIRAVRGRRNPAAPDRRRQPSSGGNGAGGSAAAPSGRRS
jgi:hypothetical protein